MFVTEDEYDELRARAGREPWATWKRSALATNSVPYDLSQPFATRIRQLAQLSGVASLTYILDPANRDAHVARVLDLIDTYDQDVYPNLSTSNWNYTIATSSPFFHLVIGLDIIHGELSSTEVAAAEAKLARVGEWYYANRTGSWLTGRIGAYGIWAVYSGEVDRVHESIEALAEAHDEETTPDGAFMCAPGYTANRFGSRSDRDTKAYYIDVLTKAGYHDYYNDPDYIARAEYFAGYLTTPVRRIAGERVERDSFNFGNSGPTRGAVWRSARAYSAGRFSPVAARNAGWSLRDVTNNHEPGLITFYVLTTDPPQGDGLVPSRIYPGGGAWFFERGDSGDALAGAMWNAAKSGEHQHPETNTIHLTAYGEHVVRNSGYNGWNKSAAGFSWIGIYNRAVVNNTVLLDYDQHFTDDLHPTGTNNHQQKFGAGIAEGFTGNLLDYACGDSGAALPNGQHLRNFVFVHPQGGAGGYWVLFDEVSADVPGVPAAIALHPNSDHDPQVVGELEEYTFQVGGPHPRSYNDVGVAFYLVTPPRSVSVKPGPLADWNESYQGRYLYTSYKTDSEGVGRATTVIYPYDQHHPKANMSRSSVPGRSFARIEHANGVTDYVVETTSTDVIRVGNITLQGSSALFRSGAGAVEQYFVRNGKKFSGHGVGFTSPQPISIHVNGTRGNVVNGTGQALRVHFTHPSVVGAVLNGSPVDTVQRGEDHVLAVIPPGTFSLELLTDEE